MENNEGHEGRELKKYLKGKGLVINNIADVLEMSTQNLHYHLRKPKTDEDFKRLITEKLKITFPLSNKGIKHEIEIPELATAILNIYAMNKVILSGIVEIISEQTGKPATLLKDQFEEAVKQQQAVIEKQFEV